ncbi:MAG: DUF3577 domain-containing protein [Halomonas sp.]|uniref:STY4534 family ICE replication protein n=1 Tax=Halomonas TaxID=2745 RepID=UPI0008B85CB6|nr:MULTISPECIES: STY4534 family ICE replication protein [Halomonas]NWN81753.1 DUF3577 domain-containing protein [Halomonas sp.]SEN69968.1 Protein of unknown function [Halomonas caseinilytica]
MTTSTQAQTTFFNLHVEGVGYLNRVRTVDPKRAEAFLACDINALNGPADDVSYTRFDCRVSGQEAQKLVRKCQQAVDMKRKVLIGFKLGDLWTDTFVYKKGDRQGETGVSLKGRLLLVKWIKIDGDTVYQREAPASDNADTPAPQADHANATPSQEVPAPTQPNGYAAAQSGESAGSFETPAAASL